MKNFSICFFLFINLQAFAQSSDQKLLKNSNLSLDLKALANCESLIKAVKSQTEKDELQRDYWILLGIVTDLSRFRTLFLKEGKFINLFPTAYYHTTYTEMRLILANQYRYPIEKMRQMIAFYDAYISNRNNWDLNKKDLVEEHWKSHFAYAEGLVVNVNFLCKEISEVLASSIIAHVQYDLPRAIRYAFNNRFNKKILPSNVDLTNDFNKTDLIFKATVAKTTSDISQIRHWCDELLTDYILNYPEGKFAIKWLNKLGLINSLTDTDVKRMRHKAWKDALFFSDPFFEPYESIMKPQPILDHSPLLEVGKNICLCENELAKSTFTINPKDVTISSDKTFKWYKWEEAPDYIKTASKFIKTGETEILFDEINEYLNQKCEVQVALIDFNSDGIAGLSIYTSNGSWCCGTSGCTFRLYENGGLLTVGLGLTDEIKPAKNGVTSSSGLFFPFKRNKFAAINNEEEIKKLFTYNKPKTEATPIALGQLIGGATPEELGKLIFKAVKTNDKNLFIACIYPHENNQDFANVEKGFGMLREGFPEQGLSNWILMKFSRVTFVKNTGFTNDGGTNKGEQVRRAFEIEFTYKEDFVGTIGSMTIVTYKGKYFIYNGGGKASLHRF